MEKLVLAIDQGTTATTCILLNQQLQVVGKESTEILPTYPQAGWVEHDLNQIWDGTLQTIKNLLKKTGLSPNAIQAIGITNQRETVGAWSKKTMIPLAPAIVWQCRRTSEICEKLKSAGKEGLVKKKTGLVLDPYFSATKMRWLLEHIPAAAAKEKSGELLFGTIDTFLLYRLTFGAVHGTDVSNASRTSLMNLETLDWDDELLNLFGVPAACLPKIFSSSEIYGRTKNIQVLPDGIPICGILGDQQAALFGQLCLQPGETKCTYGTGAFLMCNTGEKITPSKAGLLTTVAWKMNGKTTYALEGSAFVAGAAVQWLRDNLGIIKNSSEVEALALQAQDKDMGDLVFVPSLAGLGSPHWFSEARGMLYGFSRGTQKSHIARATLEGIALQNNDLLLAMANDLGHKLKVLRVDGGASANNFLIQLQSDLAEIPIHRPKMLDTTALGAAMAAGLAGGVWQNTTELQAAWQLEKTFSPSMGSNLRQEKMGRWNQAIAQILLTKK